jgi:hypothetical protein
MEKFNMFPKKKHYLLKIFRCVNNLIQDTTDVHIIGGELARASIFHLRDREFDSRCGLMIFMSKESVNALPKVVGILGELRFPPTGNIDRVGQGISAPL